jgi:hypothetical protein
MGHRNRQMGGFSTISCTMVLHEEAVPTFLPKGRLNFIILGTMVAINARIIDGIEPEEECFFYNNNRNHFWRVLQYLMDPKLKDGEAIKRLTIKEKKQFLNKNKIGIVNLVQSVVVPNKYKLDPSDTVLFEAHKKNKLHFKSMDTKIIKTIEKTPLFFTCRQKSGINKLVDGFFEHNQIKSTTKENIWYWATPTRCNPYQRSLMWKKEMQGHLKS